MASWFTLEFEATYGRGAFQLTLDTTAPAITWGTPTGTEAGNTLVIPYTLNEPHVYSAELVDAGNLHHPLLITPNEFRLQLPEDFPQGQAQARILLVDDVGNQRSVTLNIAIEGTYVPPEQPEYGGLGAHIVAGPAFTRFREFIPGEIELHGRFVEAVRGEVEFSPPQREFVFSSLGSIDLEKRFAFSVAAYRSESVYLSILQSDEELLLLI